MVTIPPIDPRPHHQCKTQIPTVVLPRVLPTRVLPQDTVWIPCILTDFDCNRHGFLFLLKPSAPTSTYDTYNTSNCCRRPTPTKTDFIFPRRPPIQHLHSVIVPCEAHGYTTSHAHCMSKASRVMSKKYRAGRCVPYLRH